MQAALSRIILAILLLAGSTTAQAEERPPTKQIPQPKLMLAELYQSGVPLRKFWVSEKLDGVRAYWDGKQLISRQGNIIAAPYWFTADFPPIALDGELWIGRRQFETLLSTLRTQPPNDMQWRRVSYQVFDLPPSSEQQSWSFSRRLQELRSLIRQARVPWLKLIPQHQIFDETVLQNELRRIVEIGGEGLMLHKGDSLYQAGRSDDLLKLKPYFDAEAVVIEHLPGKGKYTGMMGSILVETEEGIRFKIGSGFSDAERQAPPAIGTTITYKYSDISRKGVPKFASYLRERDPGEY